MKSRMNWDKNRLIGRRTLDHRHEFGVRDRADRWLFGCFRRQRAAAKQRGIPFHFTFEEWLQVWKDSGRLHQRGCSAGSFQMGRLADVGPYASSNVKIITQHENLAEAAQIRRRRLTAVST